MWLKLRNIYFIFCFYARLSLQEEEEEEEKELVRKSLLQLLKGHADKNENMLQEETDNFEKYSLRS